MGPRGTPITLTWGVALDGTFITSGAGEPAGPSDLRARLDAIYGSQTVWVPLIEQAVQSWTTDTGVTLIHEPNDDGLAINNSSSSVGSLGVRADIRLGGHPIDGNSGTVAYAHPPQNGDVVIDTNDDFFAGVTEDEFRALAEQSAWMRTEMGYYAIQSTKPQTLGYALADAPVGLLAWITEKFRSWTDNRGDIRDAVSWDALLTNVSLYWFTNTICSSTRIYLESGREAALAGGAAAYVSAPTGLAVFPGEPSRQPRAWI